VSPNIWHRLRLFHSATKYIGGHGDAIGGIVPAQGSSSPRLRKTMLLLMGGCISPFNAWLLHQGSKTLHIRMDYHCRSAEQIAMFLSGHKKIRRVFYPGLKEHPGHESLKNRWLHLAGCCLLLLAAEMPVRGS